MNNEDNVTTQRKVCDFTTVSSITHSNSSWCCKYENINKMLPTDCCATSPRAQETVADHLQQNTQELRVDVLSATHSTLHHKSMSNDTVGEWHDNAIKCTATTKGGHCNKTTDSCTIEDCSKYKNTNGSCDIGTVVKAGACRVPSIPTLIVSDTSTGKDNFVSELTSLSHCCLDNNAEISEVACNKSKEKYSTGLYKSINPNVSESMAETDNCLTESKKSNDHIIFVSRKSCDSAYASSMDSGVNTSQDDGSTVSSVGDNDVVIDGVSSGGASLSSAEESPNHGAIGICLSVSSPRMTPSPFSSSSSIASDCNEVRGEDSASGNLQIDKESRHVRNLSSSSGFSLRSSLSFEESEEDFASGDDTSLHASLSRTNSKAKAQSSWTKLRRMMIWSPFMQSFKKKYPWVQLAGHTGNFQPGEEGCILKKYVEREAECLKGLSSDPYLQKFAPTFHGIVYNSDIKYTRMEDLLLRFDNPSLMDCKMGIRTYLEDELTKAKVNPRLRNDMYQKMVQISPDEPTDEERELQAVTKPRYMQWREQVSSTSNLGFRIEGIKKSNKDPSKDYKLTKTAAQVIDAFKYFIENNVSVLEKYIERLKAMRDALEDSDFFHSHEAIGSSLLFVHDDTGLANVWMIDFGKTSRLPENQKLDHRSEWTEGNREDGYLFGMDNMINLYETIYAELQSEAGVEFGEGSAVKVPQESNTAHVGITITAPSPVTSRKPALRRQVARVHSDDYIPPSDDDIRKNNNIEGRTS